VIKFILQPLLLKVSNRKDSVMNRRKILTILCSVVVFVCYSVALVAITIEFTAPPDTNRNVDEDENGSKQVYITRTGKRYHLSSCEFVQPQRYSRILSTVTEAKGKGLKPCGVCKPPR
jgi:hypothetical protein